jgi:uncharacterized damage-inducible protein DinB
MKQYLIDTFNYNDHANKMVLEKVRELPDQTESIRLFSHLIHSMNKWLARISNTPGYVEMDWWVPVYELDELEPKWNECLQRWLDFISSKSEDELRKEVEFIGFDGSDFAAVIMDIALQLNYHSIHHRAQIQTVVRQQGFEPPFVDYIGTKYRRL